LGVSTGVYSSEYEWGITVGSFSGLSGLPQWYAHYDGVPAFTDTAEHLYGGWTHPNIKQYDDNGSSCGTSFDVNWYPDSLLPNRTINPLFKPDQ